MADDWQLEENTDRWQLEEDASVWLLEEDGAGAGGDEIFYIIGGGYYP